jgi:hypothetical protein
MKYLLFNGNQGQEIYPYSLYSIFKYEEFRAAIHNLWDVMKQYNPTAYGFIWADADETRFQMEPQGHMGYIEWRSAREIKA